MTRHGAPETIAYCACGAWYGDDADGREAHKKVFDHYPVTPPEKASEDIPQNVPGMDGHGDE